MRNQKVGRLRGMRNKISNTKIRSAAKRSKSITELASRAGYSSPASLGSNSMNRIRNNIGYSCYSEIASGFRNRNSRKNWTMPGSFSNFGI